MDQPTTTFEKPIANLSGSDGNVFFLIGTCSRALKRAGLSDEAGEMARRVMDAGSYDEALQIMMQYVDAR